MRMKKNILITFLIFSELVFCQQQPLYLEDLPRSTTFEFVAEAELYVSKKYKSELYFAIIDPNTTVFYIITQNLPDCAIISNQFGGLDIYKKLKTGGFQRIVHIRKVGENFKVHYVNEENENEKLILTASAADGHDDGSVMKLAYTFYWNSLLKK